MWLNVVCWKLADLVQSELSDARKFQDRGFAELNTRSPSRESNQTSGTKWSSSFRVFNVPETATESDLRQLFEEFGEVKDVRLCALCYRLLSCLCLPSQYSRRW